MDSELQVPAVPKQLGVCTFVKRLGGTVVFRREVAGRAEWLVFSDVQGSTVDPEKGLLRFRRREAMELAEAEELKRQEALSNRLIGEVMAEARVRELTKELLVEHNRRCRACPTCVELKDLLAKL